MIRETVLRTALNRPEQTVIVLGALVASLAHYRRTGGVPVGKLPWRYARRAFRDLGNRYFGAPRPKGVPGVVVDAKVSGVEAALRNAHFESADLYSYECAGERVGLRRPNGVRRCPDGVEIAMELHVRGFDLKRRHGCVMGDTLLIAHDEASRFEETGRHLDESVLSWDRGRDDLKSVLDDAGLAYRPIDSEADADVQVVA